MSRRNSEVETPHLGVSTHHIQHRRKGSVKCQLKSKTAPKGCPAWKTMNKDKGSRGGAGDLRRGSAQNELEAVFAKRKLKSVAEGDNDDSKIEDSVLGKPHISRSSVRVNGNRDVDSTGQKTLRPKPPPKVPTQKLSSQEVKHFETHPSSMSGIKGMLGKFLNDKDSTASESQAGKTFPSTGKLSPKTAPKPKKPDLSSSLLSSNPCSKSAPDLKSTFDVNQNNKPSSPLPTKPKPAISKAKPQVAVKPKPQISPKTVTQKTDKEVPTEERIRSAVPPPKPSRLLSQSASTPVTTADSRTEACKNYNNDSQDAGGAAEQPKSWLHRASSQPDNSGDSEKSASITVDSSECSYIYEDVDENDEAWEDCEEETKPNLYVPRKSSALLRVHTGIDGNRPKRRTKATKSKYSERKSVSANEYEDVFSDTAMSDTEEWETDDSADSDGYEIVDQEVINAIAKSYPKPGATGNTNATPSGPPPPLPAKHKEVPLRSPSLGKGDVKPRSPSHQSGSGSPFVPRRRSVTDPNAALPPLPRKGAPPPPLNKRPVIPGQSPQPDRSRLHIRLDDTVLGMRPPPPVPMEPPGREPKGYTVIDSQKGGKSPMFNRSPLGSKSPAGVDAVGAPPVPPRSPMAGATTPVSAGPLSPSLSPNTVVPPPSRPPKTPAGKPPPVKALSSASLASKIPPPKKTPDRSFSSGPQFGFPEGYLKMSNSQPAMQEHASEPTDTYIDPMNDPDFHHAEQTEKSTPEPFSDLWQNPDKDIHPDEDNYLVLVGDETDLPDESSDDRGTSVTSSIFSDEPLYQIYHAGVVARDVIEQSGEADDEDDYDDYLAIYEEAETVKNYVSTILSKGPAESPSETITSGVEQKSSLEQVAKLGAGVRKLWCEMPQVIEGKILETITPEEKKLQESLFEIITSEASYLKSLNMLVSHFMESKEFSIENDMYSVVTKREHHVLFSNVLDVRRVSRSLLLELEELWTKSCLLNISDVTSVLVDYAQNKLGVYVKYTSNQVYQERILTELIKKNFLVREALIRLQSSEECQGLTIQSFLTLPMQRITRLPLLVDAVCHRMDATHPAYHNVTACLEALQKLVKQCNEGARQMSNIEQITEIDRMLNFHKTKKIPLVNQSRYLVKKGPLLRLIKAKGSVFDKLLEKKKETLWLFLFNDLLVITKKKGTDVYEVKEHAPRISVHADLLSGDEVCKRYPNGVPAAFKNLFVMVLLEKNIEYILSCDSMSERTRWVEAVTPPMQVNEDEKIYEDWDCPQVQAIYQYTAKDSDELNLEESDVINVFRKMADGWYEGERIRDGQRGWFPSNYTVEIQSAHMRAKNLRQRYRLMQGNE